MIRIDGASGEGGGQIVRTALALSLITGAAFRIDQVRAGRAKPGLLRQHLTAVQAAQTIGDAEVDGAAIGSLTLEFRPRARRAGDYAFAVGTAGSAGLVLQAVLPALALGDGPSVLTIDGGTHNPAAPPFDFLDRTLAPLLRRMGTPLTTELERYGFYPAGGGRLTVRIDASSAFAPLSLLDRGAIVRARARAIVANLPDRIAHRELRAVREKLGWPEDDLAIVRAGRAEGAASGPGNALVLEIESEHVTEVVTAFGEIGVRAEAVAERAALEAREYLAAGVPVGPHLADQLLVPLALARGGAFRTMPLTPHSETNIDVIQRFLDVQFAIVPADGKNVVVEVSGAAVR